LQNSRQRFMLELMIDDENLCYYRTLTILMIRTQELHDIS
ncbi:2978_t:CDS:1, partial [Rhizophagus irregularis]